MLSKNLWLMLNPDKLSYDWQMGSVPLITSVMDIRNISSLAVLIISGAIVNRIYFANSVICSLTFSSHEPVDSRTTLNVYRKLSS